MKKKNEVVIPETKKKVTTVFCDICGTNLINEKTWGVYATLSYNDDGKNDEIDICKKCMKDTVMPLIRSVYKIENSNNGDGI